MSLWHIRNTGEFIINQRFTSGRMKIFTAETQRSQKFSFFPVFFVPSVAIFKRFAV